MSNSSGSYRTSLKAAMQAFDRLPKEVQFALHDASYSWAPQLLLKEVSKGQGADAVADLVRAWDEKDTALDAYRIYGPKHPQSNNFGRRLKRIPGVSIW